MEQHDLNRLCERIGKILQEGPMVTRMCHMAYIYEHIPFGTGNIGRSCINARVHVPLQ